MQFWQFFWIERNNTISEDKNEMDFLLGVEYFWHILVGFFVKFFLETVRLV